MSDQHSRLPESLKPTFVLETRAVLNEKARRWFTSDPVFFRKAAANFYRDSWLTDSGLVPQARQPSDSAARILWAQTLPVGRLWYRRDARRRKRFVRSTPAARVPGGSATAAMLAAVPVAPEPKSDVKRMKLQ